ncbi:MAG TPA: phosphatase [Cyclobacteriaceae bacterium]|nr:phosphatase [Cyclobacteriaceae bacterium]
MNSKIDLLSCADFTGMQNNLSAIIDMGTNTFHLLIADQQGDKLKYIYRERIPVKIGMGGINQGIITDEASDRALNAMQVFKQTLDEFEVKQVMAFGTSALRNAKNGKAIADKITEQTGIAIHIISGAQEAEYIFMGARKAIQMGEELNLVMDIGGGSVEFIIGNKEGISWKQSFEVGGQRLLEKFQKTDPVSEEERSSLYTYFDEQLIELKAALNQYQPQVLIGSSGTFDTLRDIYCKRMGIDKNFDDPETPLSVEGFYQIFDELIHKNRAARLQIPGMIAMRVDMIVVACCLIDWLLKNYPLQRVRVSTYALKEGALNVLMKTIDVQA